mmetsp:Transcript_31177/g.50237  ORF Transcript_31177/g.50237 Transcript_31177/m.50237 type:complete len:813 (-) Transcript_31177:15-2453(-)
MAVEISNGNLKLSLDASGWRLSSKGLCLTGWTLEVYSHDGSQIAVFDLRQADVQRQQVDVPGLGTAPGLVISGSHWQLQWALSEAAAFFQLEVLPTSSSADSSPEHSSSRSELLASPSIEHFCVPFHVDSAENELSQGQEFQRPGVEVQEDEGCCWEKRKKRTSMHSSMLVNGWQSFGFSGVLHGACRQPTTTMPFFSGAFHCGARMPEGCPYVSDPELLVSDMYGYLYLHQERCDAARGGVLAGFLSQAAGFGGFAVTSDPEPHCVLFSELQSEDRERASDWCYLSIQSGAEHDVAVQKYLEMSAKYHRLQRTKPQPVGWCSWYCHGPHVDELLMMHSLKELKTLGMDSGELPLQLFQLDDGWQSAWGDWMRPNPKFPNGLKPLADAVKAHGLVPGIWLAPAALTKGSRVAKEHPEWILRDDHGGEVSCGFTAPGLWMRALDTSMPEVLEHVKKTIRTIVHDWGFRYLKCDFLHCAAMPAKRFRPVSRAKALRLLMEAIREAAGDDVFILACGAPLGPCIGVADAARISADTADHWYPVGPDIWGTRWFFKSDRTNLPAARNMVCSTLARLHMNSRLWVNDPDCLHIRKEVDLAEAQTLASVVALSGGSVIFSDDLKSLPKDRLEILKALLPPMEIPAAEVHFTHEEIPTKVVTRLTAAVGSWRLCGLFAWQGGEVQLAMDQEYHSFEFWSCTYQRCRAGGVLSTGELKPRTGHLYALRPLEPDKAQYLGSNIHASCGFEVCKWEEADESVCFSLHVKRLVAAPEVWIFLPRASKPRLEGTSLEAAQVHPQVWRFALPPLQAAGSTLRIDW